MNRRLPVFPDDGGRAAAGFKGRTGDCVVRALAIATGEPYDKVYRAMAVGMGQLPPSRRQKAKGKTRTAATARGGVDRRVYEPWLLARGWVWVPTMSIGSGTTVHLAAGELPAVPRLIARVSKHVTAVIGGTIRDTHDPGRDGTRAVYGYYIHQSDLETTCPPMA